MAAAAAADKLRLFVYRIPYTVGPRELRDHFSQYGRINACWMKVNVKNGFHAGFGWVRFTNINSYKKALENDTHMVDGYKVIIQGKTDL